MDILASFLSSHPSIWMWAAHKSLEMVGAMAIIAQVTPRLLAWGVPASVRGADIVFNAALGSPLRPLILWKSAEIVKFLDDFSKALQQLIETFSNRLEDDLKSAAEKKSESPT